MYQTSKVWKWRIIQNNLRDKGVDAENSSKTTGKKSETKLTNAITLN